MPLERKGEDKSTSIEFECFQQWYNMIARCLAQELDFALNVMGCF
jgi:hypothetical protein